MRLIPCSFLIAAIMMSGCSRHAAIPVGSQTPTAAQAQEVDQGVRAFMQTVAHDVTQEGPLAWRRHFSQNPAFFMAVNGGMAFADPVAADKGIQAAATMIKQIELTWGNDLRVDPLTADLAVVSTSWHEVQDTTSGRIDESGYFTGTVELREGRWQFRNAHWSQPVAPAGK